MIFDTRISEAARIKAKREKVLAEERARRRRLRFETARWAKSRRIREYVAHIRTTALERSLAGTPLDTWTESALRVASDLDPTESRLAASGDESSAR